MIDRNPSSLVATIRIFYYLLPFLGLALFGPLFAQEGGFPQADFNFGIEKSLPDSLLLIQAWGSNHTARPATFDYRLLTTKSGRNGTSRTTQSGKVTVPAHKREIFSTVRLKISPGDIYEIEFLVYKNARLVSKIRYKYPPNNQAGPCMKR